MNNASDQGDLRRPKFILGPANIFWSRSNEAADITVLKAPSGTRQIAW
jgi:hypothetical protein